MKREDPADDHILVTLPFGHAMINEAYGEIKVRCVFDSGPHHRGYPHYFKSDADGDHGMHMIATMLKSFISWPETLRIAGCTFKKTSFWDYKGSVPGQAFYVGFGFDEDTWEIYDPNVEGSQRWSWDTPKVVTKEDLVAIIKPGIESLKRMKT